MLDCLPKRIVYVAVGCGNPPDNRCHGGCGCQVSPKRPPSRHKQTDANERCGERGQHLRDIEHEDVAPVEVRHRKRGDQPRVEEEATAAASACLRQVRDSEQRAADPRAGQPNDAGAEKRERRANETRAFGAAVEDRGPQPDSMALHPKCDGRPEFQRLTVQTRLRERAVEVLVASADSDGHEVLGLGTHDELELQLLPPRWVVGLKHNVVGDGLRAGSRVEGRLAHWLVRVARDKR